MAINQGKVIESLEELCRCIDRDEFIYQFLAAYGFAKATITRLRDGSRNIANGSDVGLKKHLLFRPVSTGANVYATAEAMKADPLIKGNDIRFVIATDFDSLVAFDLKADESLDTSIHLIDKQYAFFLPLAGYEKAIMYSEHPADIKASEKMGQLFDLIRERNDLSKPEDIHALNVFLTRLLFCFYAEDTGIFEQDQMTKAIESTTAISGEGLDQFFYDLFTALNLPGDSPEKAKLASHFQAFPYVNGGLFRDDEPIPEFGTKARRLLLECGSLSWAEINPDIFGSMFQAVIDQEQRGNLGQHYTSVSNIMKVIKPLFLDKLWDALDAAKGKEKKLKELLIRLQELAIADFACGSGNFLIIAYKELRRLEMAVIDALNDASAHPEMYYTGVSLSQFYGIEIDDFAHEVAILSLWLAEHQMNLEFKNKFGYADPTLPLKDSGNIIAGNALQLDWKQVCPPVDRNGNKREVYICGNPPFLGNNGRSDEQNDDMGLVFSEFKKYGMLDFVTCWFWKGAKYIKGNNAEIALVATNSISQGEQVATLWPQIFNIGIAIKFAYQTFSWSNNAKNKAAVHVVVVGLTNQSNVEKRFIYSQSKNGSISVEAHNISPYLVAGNNLAVDSRSKPISDVPVMVYGNKPVDGGNLILSPAERKVLVEGSPSSEQYIKRLLGAEEFINGKDRYCLWLSNVDIDMIDDLAIKNRIEAVRVMRASSKKAATRILSDTAHLFGEIRQRSNGTYILVPSVSSERRPYVPLGFFDASVITTNANLMVPNAGIYEFGIITSEMHNDWMRAVAGRLKSDYRYSASLVYNTFPWPEVTDTQKSHIEELAESIILIREDYPDKTLADLYDPDKMPAPLLDAHRTLDQAVEKLYRPKPFSDATERLEHLFGLYEQLIAKDKKGA